MQGVEFEKGHGVDEALESGNAEEMAALIEMQAAPCETGGVVDGEDGEGGILDFGFWILDWALPRRSGGGGG